MKPLRGANEERLWPRPRPHPRPSVGARSPIFFQYPVLPLSLSARGVRALPAKPGDAKPALPCPSGIRPADRGGCSSDGGPGHTSRSFTSPEARPVLRGARESTDQATVPALLAFGPQAPASAFLGLRWEHERGVGWVGVGALLRMTRAPIVTILPCAEAAPTPTHPTLQRAPAANASDLDVRGTENWDRECRGLRNGEPNIPPCRAWRSFLSTGREDLRRVESCRRDADWWGSSFGAGRSARAPEGG